MVHYIDKDALVAEIEKKIKQYEAAFNNPSFASYEASLIAKGKYRKLLDILQFIDTLEVKEADLEKEINKYISDNFFGSETMGFFAVRTKEEPNDMDMALCAKHFFELALSLKNN